MKQLGYPKLGKRRMQRNGTCMRNGAELAFGQVDLKFGQEICGGLGRRQCRRHGRHQGMFERFLGATDRKPEKVPRLSIDWINAAIADLQEQINALRDQLRQ